MPMLAPACPRAVIDDYPREARDAVVPVCRGGLGLRAQNGAPRASAIAARVLRVLVAVFAFTALAAASPSGGFVLGTARAADPVIAAAGDVACDPLDAHFNGGLGSGTAGSSSDVCRQASVATTIESIPNLQAVLDLGDNQYYCGSYQAFLGSYDKSWGAFKAITHPSVGNH